MFFVDLDNAKHTLTHCICFSAAYFFLLLYNLKCSTHILQAAGKYRQKGRDYIVEDGDIILFKFNAGAGLKDKKK